MLYDIGFTNMIDDAFHGYKEEGREEGIKIGRQDGFRDGETKKQNQIVQNMFKEGFSIEQIGKAVNMKKEDILKLIPNET